MGIGDKKVNVAHGGNLLPTLRQNRAKGWATLFSRCLANHPGALIEQLTFAVRHLRHDDPADTVVAQNTRQRDSCAETPVERPNRNHGMLIAQYDLCDPSRDYSNPKHAGAGPFNDRDVGITDFLLNLFFELVKGG